MKASERKKQSEQAILLNSAFVQLTSPVDSIYSKDSAWIAYGLNQDSKAFSVQQNSNKM